jgi:hypothetical protein
MSLYLDPWTGYVAPPGTPYLYDTDLWVEFLDAENTVLHTSPICHFGEIGCGSVTFETPLAGVHTIRLHHQTTTAYFYYYYFVSIDDIVVTVQSTDIVVDTVAYEAPFITNGNLTTCIVCQVSSGCL